MPATCATCGAELPNGETPCAHDGPPRAPTIALTASAILPIDPAPPPTPPPTPPAIAGAPRAEHPLIGRVLDGRYRVLGRMGTGGVGAVYEAEHVEIKKRVALKVLHQTLSARPEFRERFEREARAASRLSHPACVSVLDFGRVERVEPPGNEALIGTAYLVMELVRGQPLVDLLEGGALPADQAVRVARGMLAGLRHAHGLGIVHRDIKPANVMLLDDDEPRVKLLDFGLAKDLGSTGLAPLTQAGMVFGTPGYLSPEQAGGKPADARSDLYAVGVTLFEMVCGRAPFEHPDMVDVVRDHLLTPPPPPRQFAPSLSAALEAVILRALEKDPARRFDSAESFAAALAACPEAGGAAAGSAPSAVATPGATTVAPARAPWWRRASRRTAMAVGGGLAAAALLTLLLLSSRRPAAPPPPTPPPAVLSLSPAAQHHLALADEYQRKLWCSDTIDELERALREDPRLRSSPAITRIALPCLRPKTRARAVRFFVESVGPDARAELQAAAAEADGKPEVREGALRALEQLAVAPAAALGCAQTQDCILACDPATLDACAAACSARLDAVARRYFDALSACATPACAAPPGAGPCRAPGSFACKACVTAHCAALAAACMGH